MTWLQSLAQLKEKERKDGQWVAWVRFGVGTDGNQLADDGKPREGMKVSEGKRCVTGPETHVKAKVSDENSSLAIPSGVSSSKSAPTSTIKRSKRPAPLFEAPRRSLRKEGKVSGCVESKQGKQKSTYARSRLPCTELRRKMRRAWRVPLSGEARRRLGSRNGSIGTAEKGRRKPQTHCNNSSFSSSLKRSGKKVLASASLPVMRLARAWQQIRVMPWSAREKRKNRSGTREREAEKAGRMGQRTLGILEIEQRWRDEKNLTKLRLDMLAALRRKR
jgi:hypothetical protein